MRREKKKKGKAVNGKCRMSIDCEEQSGGKKFCMDFGSQNKDINFEVVVGSQHHHQQ